jgi:hypothetical protein
MLMSERRARKKNHLLQSRQDILDLTGFRNLSGLEFFIPPLQHQTKLAKVRLEFSFNLRKVVRVVSPPIFKFFMSAMIHLWADWRRGSGALASRGM